MSSATLSSLAATARPWSVILGVTALAFVLRAAALDSQPLLGDDVMVGQTARNFVELGWTEPTMWNHPRLRDLLVRLSLELFGNGPWGIKAWSVLLGTLSAATAALLALALTSNLSAAMVAGLCVAADPLHLDFSRQGINDVYLAFLPVASILALLRYRERRGPGWLLLAGLLLGLGAASKWSAAFPVGAATAWVLIQVLRSAGSTSERVSEGLFFGAAMVLLPIAAYVVTWSPWFARGHDLQEFVGLHLSMAFETATHTGYPGTKLPGFPGESVGAWRWFTQPVWYVDYLPPMPGRDGLEDGFFLSGVANPIVWLATLPAAAWAIWRGLGERDSGAGWLAFLFLSAYLPFVLVPRPIWANSAVAVLPFAAALIGWAASRLAHRFRRLVFAWGLAALVVAALLWPPAMGIASEPSNALTRALAAPAAFDPASHE